MRYVEEGREQEGNGMGHSREAGMRGEEGEESAELEVTRGS